MAADGRFGGHIVSGHIDGTGTITARRRDDNAVWYTVSAAPSLLRYIVEKGSIAIDGISLTVASVAADRFSVSVIPHTAAVTVLGRKRPGDIGQPGDGHHRQVCGEAAAPRRRTPPPRAASPWNF